MGSIKRENYLHIAGWMVSDLQLKGNELLIYALVYGFSQTESQEFTGAVSYIAEWCNSTKRGIYKSVSSLLDKGLLEKREFVDNGVKRCAYKAVSLFEVVNLVPKGGEQSSPGVVNLVPKGGEQSSPNIINNNIDDNIYTLVISYLNQEAGTAYRPTSAATRKLIHARVAEGFSLSNFRTVIAKQCRRWKGTKWEVYLRPATLFGTKFESYLNAPVTAPEDEQPKREKIEVPYARR